MDFMYIKIIIKWIWNLKIRYKSLEIKKLIRILKGIVYKNLFNILLEIIIIKEFSMIFQIQY